MGPIADVVPMREVSTAKQPKEELAPVGAGERKKSPRQKNMMDAQMRKTRLCHFYLQGACKYGSKCAFAHEQQELQSAPDLRKTRVCKAFKAGKCEDENCRFAHGQEELRATDLYFKTTLCIWHTRGKCANGERCRFAHGFEELRRKNDTPPADAAAGRKAADSEAMGDSSGNPKKVQLRPANAPMLQILGDMAAALMRDGGALGGGLLGHAVPAPVAAEQHEALPGQQLLVGQYLGIPPSSREGSSRPCGASSEAIAATWGPLAGMVGPKPDGGSPQPEAAAALAAQLAGRGTDPSAVAAALASLGGGGGALRAEDGVQAAKISEAYKNLAHTLSALSLQIQSLERWMKILSTSGNTQEYQALARTLAGHRYQDIMGLNYCDAAHLRTEFL
uniref:C3H1-type domain-containing protein n=1 Tax=Pyrodinium bahamense TaxID=73915 RepID=A0A7S0AM18_9DINO|mmetsp:Transcript_37580/g.104546  ORF Transcript_37580/g.104546 Transcript_37580/m.104546 type:complete len:392 (+) Transcript_37580:76-1251(+)